MHKLIVYLKGITSNYGFYIMAPLLVSYIAFVIVHAHIGQSKIINIVNNIIKVKQLNEVVDNKEIEDNLKQQETDRGKPTENMDEKMKDLQAPPRKKEKPIDFFLRLFLIKCFKEKKLINPLKQLKLLMK